MISLAKRGCLARRALALAVISCGFAAGSALGTGLIAGDMNHDGDVDLADGVLLFSCISGPNVPHNGQDMCDEADLDHDGDVDLSDYGAVQPCFTRSGVQGDPACGGCVHPRPNRALSLTATPIYSGDYTFIAVANTQEGVDYQLRNNANNANIGYAVSGTGGTIYLSSGPITTATTFNVLAINSVWGCSVQLAGTLAVSIKTYVPHNKIGTHVVIGSRNGFGPFLDQCAAAGKPVAIVKAVDDFGACHDAKQRSPQTLTIGRKNDLSSCSWGTNCDLQGFDAQADPSRSSYTPPAQFAQMVFDALHPIWDQNPSIDVWEICNEWSAWWAYQADFYIAMMDLAEAHSPPYRIALYGCSVGNPPHKNPGVDAWPDVARACARAKLHGNHILSLHEYGLEVPDLPQFPNHSLGLLQDSYAAHGDDLVLRYRRLYAYLKQHNADCDLALTEVGQGSGGGFVGTPLFVQDFAWYDSQLRQDPYVLGCTAWTLGNWEGANYQDALPALGNYIVSQP